MTRQSGTGDHGLSGILPILLAASIIIMLTPTKGWTQEAPGALTITRLQYEGGGDWYADPSSLPNLIAYTRQQTGIRINPDEVRAAIGDDVFRGSTYLYMTGHGNISFTDDEAATLRSHLIAGAFLHADDNYGMDAAFRREMQKVFPDRDWVELAPDHPIFNIVFSFPEGLPKIHEHDGKRPQGLGLFYEGRLVVFYTYECDLGDGWEGPQVHDTVTPELHEQALKMGANIITYALSR